MKLKTLKDLNWKHYHQCKCGDYNEGCLSCRDRDIKQEAIKYHKDLEEHRIKTHKTGSVEMSDRELADLIMDKCQTFIRHFFNITEEDLK